MRVERSLDTLYGSPAENDPKRASSRRPAVLPTNPKELVELKAELQDKVLQIQDF